MKIKKGDFIELDYTGKVKDGEVFDTTDEHVAKENALSRPDMKFGPVVVCVGENHLIPGLDEKLPGKDKGTFSITLEPEDAFGKKSAKLLQLIPRKYFRKQDIQPVPGLEVNIDNNYGIVRSVSGGRIIVDFNHPLSGKTLEYEITINKKVDDVEEQVKAIFSNEYNAAPNFEVKDTMLIMKDDLPEDVIEAVEKRVTELIPSIKKAVKEEKSDDKSSKKSKTSKKKSKKKSSKKSKKKSSSKESKKSKKASKKS